MLCRVFLDTNPTRPSTLLLSHCVLQETLVDYHQLKKDAKAGAEKAKKKAKEESAKAKAAAKETAAVAAKKAQETGNEATQARQLREELVAVAISSSGCKGGWRGLNGCSHLNLVTPHTSSSSVQATIHLCTACCNPSTHQPLLSRPTHTNPLSSLPSTHHTLRLLLLILP